LVFYLGADQRLDGIVWVGSIIISALASAFSRYTHTQLHTALFNLL